MSGTKGLRDILRLVNEDGGQVSVTLLVSGWWVTGTVTPTLLFDDWLQEVSLRAGRDPEAGFRFPSSRVPTPTPDALLNAVERWKEELAQGASEDQGEAITLRNCTAWLAAGRSVEFPYLAVEFSSVSAWTLGAHLPPIARLIP